MRDVRAKLSRGGRYRCRAYARSPALAWQRTSRRKPGVAVRGLIRRSAVAAGPAVVLPGPAAGATASAGAPVPGWSVTSTSSTDPDRPAVLGVVHHVESCVAIGVHAKASGRGASRAVGMDPPGLTPNAPGPTFAALLGVACSTRTTCTAVGASTIAGASRAPGGAPERRGLTYLSHRASALWLAHACRLAPS